MATNAKKKTDDVDDIAANVTEEDLRKDKQAAEVEAAKAADETAAEETPEETEETGEEDGQTETPAEEEPEEEPSFVKQVPSIVGDTQEEYLKNLETAYQQSTTEALRLKGLADEAETPEGEEIDLSDPLRLYAKQKMDEDINTAFSDFQTEYPQAVPGTPEYSQFTTEVATLSQTIMTSQKRLASPKELYSKAAVILGWEKNSTPDSKDKLGMALKDKAASPKTSSSTSIPTKSKVTDEMIQVNKQMYPNKTEAEIRKELEPYVK